MIIDYRSEVIKQLANIRFIISHIEMRVCDE